MKIGYKINTLDKAKERLKIITDETKRIKRENKIPTRSGSATTLRKLFVKHHNGKFTINKVRWKNGKHVLGDAGLYFKYQNETAWLRGYIVAKLNKFAKLQEGVKDE